jgi:hypothetical protein
MNAASHPTTQLGRLEMSSRNPATSQSPMDIPTPAAVYLTGAHVNNNFHDGLCFGAIRFDPDYFDRLRNRVGSARD